MTDTATTIDLGFRPHKWQDEFLNKWKRHNLLVCCRRFGKTVLNVVVEGTLAANNKRAGQPPRYAYIAPLKDQAREITWPYFKQYFKPLIDAGQMKIDDQGMKITIKENDAEIKLYGADKGGCEAIRGKHLDGVVFDEFDDIGMGVWMDIVLPALADFKGWSLMTGTIKGHGNLYECYIEGLDDDDWNVGRYPFSLVAEDLPAYDDEEIAKVYHRYRNKPNAFAREYEVDFEAQVDDAVIAPSDVTAARKKVVTKGTFELGPKIMGVDVARFGNDNCCIVKRQGIFCHEPIVIGSINNMEFANVVARHIVEWGPDAVFIDAGRGEGVIDRLRQLGHSVIEVPFGGSAQDNGRYQNKRAEMWFKMCDWVREGGSLPNNERLCHDLTSVRYEYGSGGRLIKLWSKERIKELTGRSPDLGDALALTFSHKVVTEQDRTDRSLHRASMVARNRRNDYHPLQRQSAFNNKARVRP